jgi:endonuclease/exonuclease/phosphatase family metal-dependent hydrolase
MAAKKKARPAAAKKKRSTKAPQATFFDRGDVEDHISRLLDAQKLVPAKYRGTDEFLDVVSWNIRWFDHKDSRRVDAILKVLETINADVFVLVEIAHDGALDDIANQLAAQDSGYYTVAYGQTGAEQRVVLMWDRDWVRLKQPVRELFDIDLKVAAEDGKQREVFPRLPLYGYFEGLSSTPGTEGFTFELVGVHLKSQMPPMGFGGGRFGIKQREKAAETLAQWLQEDDQHADEDVIVIGDWNAAPGTKEWKPLRQLEQQGEIGFESINPAKEVTHIARLNKSGPGGTRLDFHLVTKPAQAHAVPNQKAVVIQWSLFDHLDELATGDRTVLYKAMRTNFSDHLPCVTRFYFTA